MGLFSWLVYITISFLTGGLLILISTSPSYIPQIESFLISIYASLNLRIICGLSGLLIILICIKTIQDSLAKNMREKTIGFEGNYGEVSISLSAVEDILKKLILEFREVKEIRPYVSASKKGLQIILKTTLSSYTNIPEFTSRIQTLVKERIQNMLGIEEEIRIKVEIKKIIYPEEKNKKQEVYQESPTIPYREYQ